jgi:geranylgeranyl pyrophosphate synthase
VSDETFNCLSTQINKSKRIRSLFLKLLTQNTLKENDLLTISLAIEFFHQSTLILDDIIDNSSYRE